MIDNKKAEALLTKAASLVETAQARIQSLETTITALQSEKQATVKQASDINALGDRIFKGMVGVGRAKDEDRERVLSNLSQPVKIAEELVRVLEASQPVTVGAADAGIEDTPVEAEGGMKTANEKYLERCGMA